MKFKGMTQQWGSLEKESERKQYNWVKYRVASKTKTQGFRKSVAFTGHPCMFKSPLFALETISTVSKPVSHWYFSSDPVNCKAREKSLRNLPFTFKNHPNRESSFLPAQYMYLS